MRRVETVSFNNFHNPISKNAKIQSLCQHPHYFAHAIHATRSHTTPKKSSPTRLSSKPPPILHILQLLNHLHTYLKLALLKRKQSATYDSINAAETLSSVGNLLLQLKVSDKNNSKIESTHICSVHMQFLLLLQHSC